MFSYPGNLYELYVQLFCTVWIILCDTSYTNPFIGLKKVVKSNYWVLLCCIKIAQIVNEFDQFCVSSFFSAENITAFVLFHQGMQNPARSRPCPAAKYFLKAADFVTGGCFLFLFHVKLFQKVKKQMLWQKCRYYFWQMEYFSFVRTFSNLLQARIENSLYCPFCVSNKINLMQTFVKGQFHRNGDLVLV